MNMRVQVDGQVYEIEIGDLSSRPIQAVVDGEIFEVWPEEAASPVAAQMTVAQPTIARAFEPQPRTVPRSDPGNGQTQIVASPLPGVIVAVAVQAGQTVDVGQLLCTVESMKMNNAVRSSFAGVVEEVLVTVGNHVNHGQAMLRLRPSTAAEG